MVFLSLVAELNWTRCTPVDTLTGDRTPDSWFVSWNLGFRAIYFPKKI
jgi:hypothetical protein